MKKDQVEKTTRYKILKSQKWQCAYCGKKINFSKHHLERYGGDTAHMDHIHPQSKKESYEGFIGEIRNLQALCPNCNLKKSAKIVGENLCYCPQCNSSLEVGTINMSEDPYDVEVIYICNTCDTFFSEYECLKSPK